MHQWIANLVDNGTVQLRVLALDSQVDILVQLLGQVADHAREAVEYLAYRHHADLHYYGLQVGSHPVHLLQRLCQLRQAMSHADLLQADLVGNQLAHQVHQGIQLLDINPDGLACHMSLLVMLGVIGRCLCCRLGGRSCCLRCCCRSRCLGCRLRCRNRCRCLLRSFLQVNLRYLHAADLGDSRHALLHLLGIRIRYQAHIKAVVEFLLLQVLGRRNRFDDITQLIQHIHDHVGAGRLQKAGISNLHMHPVRNQAAVLCLLDDQHIGVIQLAALRHAGSCRRCRCCPAVGFRPFLLDALPLGDGIHHAHQVGYIHQVLGLTVANVLHHLLQGVNALEDNIYNLRAYLQLFLPEHIQQVLHVMGKLGSLGVAHGR